MTTHPARNGDDMLGRRSDEGAPLARAVQAAAGLKAGTWESVEALAYLAVASKASPDGAAALRQATDTAAGLKAGTWESVRALAVLAWATDELGA